MVACYRKIVRKDGTHRAVEASSVVPHRFDWRIGAKNLKNELRNLIIQFQGAAGYGYPVVVGLVDGASPKLVKDKADFLYGDHAYFNRGWHIGNFRLIRNGHHQTQTVPRPDDRIKKSGAVIGPDRKGRRSNERRKSRHCARK